MPLLGLAAVVLLVLANAFFVIAEYALVTARRSALERKAADGSGGARVALRLMDEPVRLIGTVQIGITALGILLGAVGEPAVRDVLGEDVPGWVSFAAGFLVTTYLSVAFGELVPKALALHGPEPIAVAVARPIDVFSRVFAPAVWVLQTSARLVLRPLGVPSVTAGERPVSREELLTIVADAEEAGSLRAEEEDAISAIVGLRSRTVAELMVPWHDVVVTDLARPAADAAADVAASAHTRLPLLRTAGGPVVGVLHAKDVWRAQQAGGPLDLEALARDVVGVPPSAHIDVALGQLRAARQHLAVVLDEYGAPLGIVTLEDILEEVVGDIEDELDPPRLDVERRADGTVVVPGAMSVGDLARATGIALPPGRAHSVGGVLQQALGRVPAAGDTAEVDGTALRAAAVEDHRIVAVEVRPAS